VDAIRFVKQKIENLIVLQLLTEENSLLMIAFTIKTALKTDKAESYLCSIFHSTFLREGDFTSGKPFF